MTTTARTPVQTGAQTPDRPVRWGAVALFVVLSFGLAWLISLPLWLGDGLASPLALPVAGVIMAAPAIAAVVVVLGTRTAAPASYLGLTRGTGWRRTVRFGLFGAVAATLVSLAAVLVAAAAGWTTLGFSSGSAGELLLLPVMALGVAIPAVGEEIGWRGFLQQELAPLGTWPSLVLTGILWGLWHAPLVLLGYNYGSTAPLVLVPMVVTTILMGVLIGWLRMRTDSIYPGALAHGALNASTSVLPLGLLVGGAVDVSGTVLGWGGWLVVLAVAAVLVATRSFTWARPPRALGSAAA